MHRLAALMLLLAVTACKVGPNYYRPDVDIPLRYIYDDGTATEAADTVWWNQFGDPVLNELIDTALANNQGVKAAAGNIEAAVGTLIQTRAPLFPQISYNGLYNRTRLSETLASTGPGFLLINPQTTWQALIEGSWQIDLWGRTQRLVEAAAANVYSAYQARQGVILSLVATVASTYFELRGLDEQLVISMKTTQSYAEAVDYFEKQFKYGQTSLMTVAQARTQYEIAAAKIPQIKAQIVQTENALCVLLGSNPTCIPRGKSIYDLKLPAIPCSLPSTLLNRLPSILQAEENLVAANAQIGAAEALYFPQISLTGGYGNASQDLHNLFTGPSHTWSYTGSIVGPIFTAGLIYGQVVEAEGLQQAALHDYILAIQTAFADVETAFNTHTMLVDEIQALERLVQAAGEYEHLANLQFMGGYSPYYVVIQAQEQYFPAELQWAQAKAALFISIVNIYQALGGGWVDTAAARTEVLPCD